MIERLKEYLLRYNMNTIIGKTHKGTAANQDLESLVRMDSYKRKGHW
jgi:hypothetical protein